MKNLTFSVGVLEKNLGSFLRKCEKIKRICVSKLGVAFSIAESSCVKKVCVYQSSFFTNCIRLQNYYTYTVSCSTNLPVQKDVSFIGMSVVSDGVKQVFTQKKYKEEFLLSNEIPRCDCCGVDRYRTKHFFFLRNNVLECIGSSCVESYFGIDLRVLLSMISFEDSFEEEEEKENHKITSGFYLVDVLAVVLFKLRGGDWTKNLVQNSLVPLLFPTTKGEIQEKENFLRYIKEKSGEPFLQNVLSDIERKAVKFSPKTDFDYNMKAVLLDDSNKIRDYVSSKENMVAYALHFFMKKEKAPSKTIQKGDFVGAVGDKITMKATIVNTKMIATPYGETMLVSFVDTNNNNLSWFKSSFSEEFSQHGQVVTIKAAVKKHDIFNKKRVTYLTRVKICA